jgi:hypothetical protein
MKGLIMKFQLTANNRKTARTISLAGFVVLVVVMMFLAGQVSQLAADGIQHAPTANIFELQMDILEDGVNQVSRFCYKSCTLIR